MLLFGGAIATEAFAQEDALTLEQAIVIAVEGNPGLAAAASRVAAAEASVVEASSARLPAVRLEGGVQYTDNAVLVFSQRLLQESFGAQDFALDALNRPDALADWSARVTLTQPFWMGGRLRGAVDAAAASRNAAIAEHERALDELAAEVAIRYAGAIVAHYAIEVGRAAQKVATANVELASDQVELGTAVESDLLLARVRASEVEELIVQAEARERLARAMLNAAMGRDQSTPLRLPERLELMSGDRPGAEQQLTLALDARPDLEAIEHRQEMAAAELRRARALRRPELGLSASFETHAEDFFGNDGDAATVAIGLRLSLFEGRATRARVDHAQARLEELEHLARLQTQKVELELRRASSDIDVALRRLELGETGIDQARRSLAIVEDRYRNGLVTIVDLLEAEAMLTRALEREASARGDLATAQVTLDLAAGRL